MRSNIFILSPADKGKQWLNNRLKIRRHFLIFSNWINTKGACGISSFEAVKRNNSLACSSQQYVQVGLDMHYWGVSISLGCIRRLMGRNKTATDLLGKCLLKSLHSVATGKFCGKLLHMEMALFGCRFIFLAQNVKQPFYEWKRLSSRVGASLDPAPMIIILQLPLGKILFGGPACCTHKCSAEAMSAGLNPC